MQRPDPEGTKTLLRRIYAGQKYPHVYTLSISTGKNQSSEIRGALHIQIYEYNYKVITRSDIILHEYYIIDRRNCENTRRYTSTNSTKGAQSLQKENSRDAQEAWKNRALDDLQMIHATATHF